MKKTLVVLAAGMGSRFGGLKQIEPVGPCGEFIIDYSVHDAIRAGFDKVVFVIRRAHLDVFKETIGKRLEDKVEVAYAFQELDVLPRKVDVAREKMFGTGHALYCAKDEIEGDFAVISADDYYGFEAFNDLGNFMNDNFGVGVVGFLAKDTILEDEEVKRGMIFANNGVITKLCESKVHKADGKIYGEPLNGDAKFVQDDSSSMASMLMYGFKHDFIDRVEKGLLEFLDTANIEVDEFYLPNVIDAAIKDGIVKLIPTKSVWMGMTYREDLAKVQEYINKQIELGIYPKNLHRIYKRHFIFKPES